MDRFIPWSRYPLELGHNFVLADSACNQDKRGMVAAAPDIPTIAEAGLPGHEESMRLAAAIPAATPAAIGKTLNAALLAALKSSEVSTVLTRDGAQLVGSSAPQCAAFLDSELRNYAQVVRKARIKPQE